MYTFNYVHYVTVEIIKLISILNSDTKLWGINMI